MEFATSTADKDVEHDEAKEESEDKYSLTDEQLKTLNLNEDTLAAIRDVFGTLDEDDSGTLDTAELETAMKHMEVECTTEEIEELVKQIDEDGNGTVDFYEFARMVSGKLQDFDPEKELREAFSVFDKNGDGMVSTDEIKEVVESLGGKMTNEELDAMLLEVDVNNDGFLDYGEFVRIWTSYETTAVKENKAENLDKDDDDKRSLNEEDGETETA